MISEKNLTWLDLEMTGLSPEQNVILEIATIITTSDLIELAQSPSVVIHQDESTLARMNAFVKDLHTKSGLLEKVQLATINTQQAEEQILKFVEEWCVPNKAILCGNSIHQDRAFLRRYMPRLHEFFHYRMIDVSTVKELVNRWYAGQPGVPFEKKKVHRALDDIRESIQELDFYKQHFFKQL